MSHNDQYQLSVKRNNLGKFVNFVKCLLCYLTNYYIRNSEWCLCCMVHDIFSKYKQMTENSVFKFGCTCVTQKGYALQVRPQSKTLILVRCTLYQRKTSV